MLFLHKERKTVRVRSRLPSSNLQFLHYDAMWSTSSIKALFIQAGQASTPPTFLSPSVNLISPIWPTWSARQSLKDPKMKAACFWICFRDSKSSCATMHVGTYQVFRSCPNSFLSCQLSCRPLSQPKWITLSPAAQKVYRLYLLSPVKAAFLAPFGPNCLLGQVFCCIRRRGTQK